MGKTKLVLFIRMKKYGFWWVSKYARFLEQGGGPSFNKSTGFWFSITERFKLMNRSHTFVITSNFTRALLVLEWDKKFYFHHFFLWNICRETQKLCRFAGEVLIALGSLWENIWCQYQSRRGWSSHINSILKCYIAN